MPKLGGPFFLLLQKDNMSLPTLMVKGKLYSDDVAKLNELSEWIPIEYILDWFKTRLYKNGIENRVLVLKSETSSGKSTLLPPSLYRAFLQNNKKGLGLICTQPRVMTTIENVLEMLPYNKFLSLGRTIGWSTKSNKIKPSNVSVLSATVGTLADQLKSMTDDEICARYLFIMIDETHERDLQTDMTIYILKGFIMRCAHRHDCPFVVLMSATFEPVKFLQYFGVGNDNFIWCRGAAQGFSEMWDWNEDRTIADYSRASVDVVRKIITENPNDDPLKADILIFLPGKSEMSDVFANLQTYNAELASSGGKVFVPLLVDGEGVNLQNEDFRKTMRIPVENQTVTINHKKYKPTRRVVLSTVVAETGLTMSNLRYVIDAGFNRETEFNPVYGISMLLTKPAPQPRTIQRKGRAGRKHPGVFYPLYPKWIWDKLPTSQYPSILVNDISPIMLDLIAEQLRSKIAANKPPIFRMEDIDLLDIPSSDALSFAIEKLYLLGYIAPSTPQWDFDLTKFLQSPKSLSTNGLSITKLGALARLLNSESLENARMILAGYSYEVSILDLIAIDVWVTLDGKRGIKNDKMKMPNWSAIYKSSLPQFNTTNIVEKIKVLLCDDFIDGILFFNAIKKILVGVSHKKLSSTLREWCKDNEISYKFCISFMSSRDAVIETLITNSFDVYGQEIFSLGNNSAKNLLDVVSKLKKCIYDGYRMNSVKLVGDLYKTKMGLTIKTPKLFTGPTNKDPNLQFIHNLQPKNIVASGFSAKLNRETLIYDVVTPYICVLDGFVNPDNHFV